MINKIVLLDTETTGIKPEEGAKVLEVAAIILSNESGSWEALTNHWQSYVEFEGEIPPEARAVHHISPNDVKPGAPDCYPYDVVIKEMLDAEEEGSCYAAHNAKFDSGFLPELTLPWLCTHRCALHIYPDAPRYSNQVLRYFLGIEPDPKLIEGLAPHRALYDTAVTAGLLLDMLGKGYTPEQLIRMTSTPILQVTCKFGSKHFDQPWAEVPRSYMNWMLREGVRADDIDIQHTIRHYLGLL